MSSARISALRSSGHALVGVERKNPVVGRQARGVIFLLDVAVPRPHVDAIGEPARDRHGVVGAFRIDDDDLVGPGERRQRVGDGVGFVLRDDDGGNGRHCSGIVYYAVDMEQNEALALYRRTGAYLEGHFRLSSGLHSTGYLQSALVLQNPADAAALGAAIASRVTHLQPDGGAVAGARRAHHRP